MTNAKPVYELAFPEGTSKEVIANHEALALDALVAAGKIRETDRSEVVFIVNSIVKPRFDEDGSMIPRNMVN